MNHSIMRRNIVRIKDVQRASRRLEVIPLDGAPGQYLVGSASKPGEYYEVHVDAETLGGECSCPWAQHGGINCKHVLAVLQAHYAEQGRLSFWRNRHDARRQHRRIIAGETLFATLRRAA